MIFWLSGVLLISSALLGGGTRAGFVGDVIVQLLAIPLLLGAVWQGAKPRPIDLPLRRAYGFPLLMAALAVCGMLVVQLLPLPGSVWADWLAAKPVPRAEFAGDGIAAAWRGLSLTPSASWAAATSLLPPVAVFLGASQLEAGSRFKLVALVIGLGALGLFIGFLQVVQGPQSSLRFFEFTNPSEAVGFFANRNHFAAALYTTLVFAAVWFAFAATDFVRLGAFDTRAIFWFVAATVLLIAIIAGLALARSRAGIMLTFVAVAGIVAAMLMDRQASNARLANVLSVQRLTVGTLVVAMLFAAQFGLHRAMIRFEADPLDDLRFALTPATLRIALESLPFGTGLGSFATVYATVEKTTDLFTGYANRAHNDWAEFLLEGGVLAAVAMLAFLWWFTACVVVVWSRVACEQMDGHQMLQRGATIVIALLLAHSLVDYPLRTTAISTLFAFSCAVLIPPPGPRMPRPKPPQHPERSRAVRRRREGASQERWGSDIEWPEAWKQGT